MASKNSYTIISHLTPREWKESFYDKVIEDTEENMKKYTLTTCYWGHFTGDDTFTLCHHKEAESKTMSISQYYEGKIEKDERGCKITGTFKRKKSANIFMGMGAILCIFAMIGSIGRHDTEVLFTSGVLFLILLFLYFYRPKSTQDKIKSRLQKISFDKAYHRQKITANPNKKKQQFKRKLSMKEKASVETTEELKAEGALLETTSELPEEGQEFVEDKPAKTETFAESVAAISAVAEEYDPEEWKDDEEAEASGETEEAAEETSEESEQVIKVDDIINNLKLNK